MRVESCVHSSHERSPRLWPCSSSRKPGRHRTASDGQSTPERQITRRAERPKGIIENREWTPRNANEQPRDEATIAPLLHSIRGLRIILDTDLAKLYGVQTFRLNEAIKRNRERFPDDFMFQLTSAERDCLISQFAISKAGRGGRRTLPHAFTEHGARQAANILNSPRAVALSVYIIRAIVKTREEQAANAAVLTRLAEIDKTLLIPDSALRDIYQKLRPLLEPPPTPPKPQIGFHVKENAVPYRTKLAGKKARQTRLH
jgi:hypothetical protein